MAKNNDDIITEILYRLPIKSVYRFKCVSQGWLSVISHPLFFQNYFLHHKIPSFGVFLQPPSRCKDRVPEFISISSRNSAGVPNPSFTYLFRHTGFTIEHACNGLLLCRILNQNLSFICNPTTMEYTPLPLSKVSTIDGINLVFNPSKSSAVDYKVICVRMSENSIHCKQIDVYSSNTGSWRVSVDALSPPGHIHFQRGVLWNNALNWIGLGGYSVSYNIQAEGLRTTSLPPKPQGKNRIIMYYGASQGHLHFIVAYGYLTTEFDILEMERDFSRWSISYHVNLDTVKKAFPEMVVPLMFRNGHRLRYSLISLLRGAEEGVMLMINISGKILSYHIRDGTFFKVCDLQSSITKRNNICEFYEWYEAFPYTSIPYSFRSS